eukprot:scaffold3219_cov105-Isochrysis_galbana.AAC.1
MARRRCPAATVPAGAAAPSRTRGACASGGPPGRQARAARGAAGRWPPAGTRRRWPGQGLPARAGRAGPRGARPRCGRGAERRA